MIPNRLLNQPVQILNRSTGSTDAYNNEVPGFAAPVAANGYLDMKVTTERVNDRDVVITDRELYLQAGTQIGPLDRVVFQGQTFEVVGEPERVWNPRRQVISHVRCLLVTVVGG